MNEAPAVDTTGPAQPRLIDVVAAELHDLQNESMNFRKKIDEAKTQVKRQYYKKKLRKNNKRMMNMLVAFEKLRGRADTSTDAPVQADPELPEQPIVPED